MRIITREPRELPEIGIDRGKRKRTIDENEHNAKRIPPEPRSVQKASSYQFTIRHDLKTLMQMLTIFVVAIVFDFHAAAEVQVWQANEYGSARYPAANATDGNAATFSTTSGDFPNEFWMADLGQVFNLDRIEITSRLDCCANRHAGLVLRIYDAASNNISSATLTDVGLGGTYTHTLTPGTPVRWIRVGLENGQPNGGGDFFVELGEVRAYSGTTNVLKPSIFIQVGGRWCRAVFL